MRLDCHVHIPAENLIDRLPIAERYSRAMNFLELFSMPQIEIQTLFSSHLLYMEKILRIFGV